MPNHVTNMVLSSPEVIAQLMNTDGCPDFTQVSPYPKEMEYDFDGINIMVEEAVRQALPKLTESNAARNDFAADKHHDERAIKQFNTMADNVLKTGFRHTMDWNLGIWSTKWNCYDFDKERSAEDRVVFDTAWGMPEGLLRELSANNVETPIVALFADEDVGRNCGIFVFLGGNIIYDQQAEIDRWGVGRIQDRWSEFAISLKNYDYCEEDMEELRQIPIMHKLFRDKKPIGRLTPQARKLAGLDNQDDQSPIFLTALFNAVCKRDSGVSFNYNSKGVTAFSRDYETETAEHEWMMSKHHDGEFFYVADNAVIEFDFDAISEIFADLDEHNSYTTDVKLLPLLQYCGDEGMNLARVLGILVNFNSLVASLRQPHTILQEAEDLDWVVDWMSRNRECDMTLEFDLFRQFVMGEIQFTSWADKADLPKPSLVPATVLNASFQGMDESRLGYEQCRVFKSMCMLYQYRNIITHNSISTEYMDSVDGKVYQVIHGKFSNLVHTCISNGLPDL
ncbi:hypothetical protein pVa21_095 [Vibrio phage pVa-21]|nr:hypothetical protein pVa21_095 [Vibrio phage pVa-21]